MVQTLATAVAAAAVIPAVVQTLQEALEVPVVREQFCQLLDLLSLMQREPEAVMQVQVLLAVETVLLTQETGAVAAAIHPQLYQQAQAAQVLLFFAIQIPLRICPLAADLLTALPTLVDIKFIHLQQAQLLRKLQATTAS
jgi:hypothetical protein